MNKHLAIHGEAILSGDTSAGIAFKIFQFGVDTTSKISTGKYGVVITDIDCVVENEATAKVIAGDTDGDGKRILYVPAAANGGIARSFAVEHYLPIGTLPYFFGAATGLNSCIIHGYLYEKQS